MILPDRGKYPVTQRFGGNAQIYAQLGMIGHNGLDVGTPLNTPLVAPIGGRVYAGFEANGYGNYVFITGGGLEIVVGHMNRLDVVSGQNVNEGQPIGLSGSTGFSSGPHYHFGTRPIPYNRGNGYFGYEDPYKYLGVSMVTISEPEYRDLKGWKELGIVLKNERDNVLYPMIEDLKNEISILKKQLAQLTPILTPAETAEFKKLLDKLTGN